MLTLLTHPVPARRAALLALALAAANTLYCQAYNTLAGRPEALSVSLIWFAVNVLPWFVAFEACKRLAPCLPSGRAELVRMTLRAAEGALPGPDFIRVHRTLLVRRDRIAAHRRGKEHDEVHLSDGSVQRVGESYRAQVARLFADAA